MCPLSANVYGIEFLKFEVKDYDTGKVVYQVSLRVRVLCGYYVWG